MPELQINIKDEVTSFEAMWVNTYAIAAMDQKSNMIVYKRGLDEYIVFFEDCSIGVRTIKELSSDGITMVRGIGLKKITFEENK